MLFLYVKIPGEKLTGYFLALILCDIYISGISAVNPGTVNA